MATAFGRLLLLLLQVSRRAAALHPRNRLGIYTTTLKSNWRTPKRRRTNTQNERGVGGGGGGGRKGKEIECQKLISVNVGPGSIVCAGYLRPNMRTRWRPRYKILQDITSALLLLLLFGRRRSDSFVKWFTISFFIFFILKCGEKRSWVKESINKREWQPSCLKMKKAFKKKMLSSNPLAWMYLFGCGVPSTVELLQGRPLPLFFFFVFF